MLSQQDMEDFMEIEAALVEEDEDAAKPGKPSERDFGAEMREWADFALSRSSQATRRDTGMPKPVMMLMTLQATLASVFCVGKVRA